MRKKKKKLKPKDMGTETKSPNTSDNVCIQLLKPRLREWGEAIVTKQQYTLKMATSIDATGNSYAK